MDPFVVNMARAQGVEPQPSEPESDVLPLDNARVIIFLERS